jgi:hypothetical protein
MLLSVLAVCLIDVTLNDIERGRLRGLFFTQGNSGKLPPTALGDNQRSDLMPIYHPPVDHRSDAILAAEAMLLERDGVYHVGQLYFASEADASFVRFLAAERIVRSTESKP